ncbi:MAG: DUF1587 domain-containing protein, partial [Verrucomicrobiales bacterium]
MTHRTTLLFLVILLGLGGERAFAGLPALQPFLDQHCMDCHDADVKKGGLDLSALSIDGANAAAHKEWVRVFDRVSVGEMPPVKKPRPSPEHLQTFLSTLGADLTAVVMARKGTVLRRLNRREYQNTINDLLGVRVDVIDLLPPDGRAHGFDNVGEALSISGMQLQRYMEAAELALNATLVGNEPPESTTATFTLEVGRNLENLGKHWLKRDDGAVVVFNEGGFPSTQIPNLRVRKAGNHRLRITGYGYQIGEPVVFALITGNFGRGGVQEIRSFHEVPVDQPATIETTLWLNEGDGIKISPQGLNGPDGHSPNKDGPEKYP